MKKISWIRWLCFEPIAEHINLYQERIENSKDIIDERKKV